MVATHGRNRSAQSQLLPAAAASQHGNGARTGGMCDKAFAECENVNGNILIGAVALPNPVFLAPMSGVTDAPFRRVVASLGAGLVISEMTASPLLSQCPRNPPPRVQGH